MVDEATTIRCENLACLCEVSASDATCSEYCASPSGRDTLDIRCNCGHSACVDTIEQQLSGEAGRETV